jgi:hypothetical protein
MSEQLTDQVLVERVQKGDQKAFNLLVVRYQHKVASLVSRYVPSGDVLMLFKSRLLRPIVRWILSGEIVLFIPGYTVSPSIRRRIIWLLRDAVRRPAMLTQSTPKTSKVAAH